MKLKALKPPNCWSCSYYKFVGGDNNNSVSWGACDLHKKYVVATHRCKDIKIGRQTV